MANPVVSTVIEIPAYPLLYCLISGKEIVAVLYTIIVNKGRNTSNYENACPMGDVVTKGAYPNRFGMLNVIVTSD